MKLLKVLDQESTNLVSDPINQIILKELVTQPNKPSQTSPPNSTSPH